MPRTQLLFLSPAVLLTACISLPEVEAPQGAPDGGSPDAGGHTPSLILTLATPSATTYTSGTVSVQLQVQGDTPEQVELLVDDQPLTTMAAPYAFNWNTASVAEGTHRLGARARIGDKAFASEVRDVVVDRTAPQVVSRTPTPGAQDVWVRQPIQATFSEPLKASTLSSASVKLSVGGTEVVTTPLLSADGKTLTVTPASRLTVPNSLQLTFTAAVTDLAGNQLTIPNGTWSWSLPTSFSMGALSAVPGNTSVESPFLQLDHQEHPFVVWREQFTFDKSNIYVYRWSGTDWDSVGPALNETPTVSSSTASFNLNQQIQIDSSNTPVVAWVQSDDASSGIYVKRWSNNSWTAIGNPLNVFPASPKPPRSLALQLDTNDRPVITWEQPGNTSSTISINTWKWTGQTWMDLGGPLPVSQIENQAYPALVLDNANTPIIAWASYSSDPALDGILVRRWTGSSWVPLGSALDANAQSSTPATTPSLILDSSGTPIVAWSESDGTAPNVYVYRWTGTIWEPLGNALSAFPGNTAATSPILSKDASGNLFISWCEAGGHLSRWNGSTWEASLATPTACATAFTVDNAGTPFGTLVAYPDASSSSTIVSIYRGNY